MKIFIDTEFTCGETLDLISIGLVAEDGNSFYAERSDFDLALCNDFVRETVLPLLGAPGAMVLSLPALKLAVRDWLDSFKGQSPQICFDHIIDWSLLWELYDRDAPAWLGTRNIRSKIDVREKKKFFDETGLPAHHAWNDAMCNWVVMSLDPFANFTDDQEST